MKQLHSNPLVWVFDLLPTRQNMLGYTGTRQEKNCIEMIKSYLSTGWTWKKTSGSSLPNSGNAEKTATGKRMGEIRCICN